MKTIAVGSGKGGVGKTTITSNLAVTAALRGQRVVALDADYGLANLHLHLGLFGTLTVEEVLLGECTLDEAMQRHPSGLHLLAGSSGSQKMANISPALAEKALRQFDILETMTDVMFIDVSAGIHETALMNLAAADISLIVVTPDPSSFVDAFATVKLLSAYAENNRIAIVINQAESESNAKLLFARFQTVVKEQIGLVLQYQGCVCRDSHITRTGVERRPIVEAHPNSSGSRQIQKIAEDLLDLDPSSQSKHGGFLARLFGRRNQHQRVA